MKSSQKICTYDGCNRSLYAKGWCSAHYQQVFHGKKLAPVAQQVKTCTYPGCDHAARGNGLCNAHYLQVFRGGELHPLGYMPPSDFIFFGDHVDVVLRDKHSAEVGRAVIDVNDVYLVYDFRWFMDVGGYAVRKERRSNGRELTVWMHRQLLGEPRDQGDHFDGDRLNNRRGNLRVVTASGNAQNSVRPGRKLDRNVYCEKRTKNRPWYVQVQINYKVHVRRGYATKEEARVAARELRAEVLTHHNEARHSEV